MDSVLWPLPPRAGLQQNRSHQRLLGPPAVSREGPWADGHPREAQHTGVLVHLWGAARQAEAGVEPSLPRCVVHGLMGKRRKGRGAGGCVSLL